MYKLEPEVVAHELGRRWGGQGRKIGVEGNRTYSSWRWMRTAYSSTIRDLAWLTRGLRGEDSKGLEDGRFGLTRSSLTLVVVRELLRV